MPTNKWTTEANEQLLTLIVQMYVDKTIDYNKVAAHMSAKTGNNYTAKAIQCRYLFLKGGKEKSLVQKGIKQDGDEKSVMSFKKGMKRERDFEEGANETGEKSKKVKREVEDKIKQEQW